MAGAILVSENIGVSLNSLDFDHIIEKIRPFFSVGKDVFRDEIYNPVDEGGMSFITLVEQSEDGFIAFFQAATTAYQNELQERPLSARRGAWEELMQALRSDPRAKDCKNNEDSGLG
jgi:hypothetical protein